MVDTKVKLAYWGVRGLGQLPRYTLEAAGVSYEETKYTDFALWFQTDKPKVKNPLANLPILTDGDVEITEHDAIVRYVARKFRPDLLGNTDAEYGLVENLFTYFTKLRSKEGEFCNKADPTEEGRVAFVNGYSA